MTSMRRQTRLRDAQQVPAALATKMAIATSMATIMFTSLSSVRAHHQRGAVRWDLVKGLAPGILMGGLLAGAGLFALLKGAWLALVFAGFVSFSGWQMLRNKRPAPSRQMPGTAGQLGAGAGIGLLSGLVGAGGGFVSVPFMVWCNVPVHFAVEFNLAGLPGGYYLEHMPWFEKIYREKIELDAAGNAIVPDRPGWGFSFDPEAAKKYATG